VIIELSEPAAIKKRTFGDVAPIHDRRAELLVAFIDFLGKLVPGADLGDDILADREKGLEQGVIELQDFDPAFVAQLAQRQRSRRFLAGQHALILDAEVRRLHRVNKLLHISC
jgi:hypothetical protein